MKIRRIGALALVLMLLMGMLAGAMADTSTCNVTGGKHKWGKWKTVEKATCLAGGLEMRTCSACGTSERRTTDKGKHSYGSWKVTKEATCTKNGERTRTCKLCGHVDTQKTDKKPHQFGAWTVLKEATCAEAGSRSHICKVCGHKETQSSPKLPHTWGDWEEIVPVTDHSAGTRARTCQVCGAQETEDVEPEGTLRRGDRGDDVRELQQGLICYGVLKGRADGTFGRGTESAVKQVQEAEGLAVDGVAWPQTRAFLGHKFGEWVVESELSDFSMGLKHRTCERCGYEERVEEWPSPMYRRGDRGDGVKALQQALNDAGYNCGRPDGSFGGRTASAVSGFEAANGIEPDGIAWPGVLKLLGMPVPEVSPEALEAPPMLSLSVTPMNDQITWDQGEEVQFDLKLVNNGETSLTDVAILAYDGQGALRAEYSYGGGELAPGGTFDVEDAYGFTEKDIGDVTLVWLGVGTAGGANLAIPTSLEYAVYPIEPGDPMDDEWEPPQDSELLEVVKSVKGGEGKLFHVGEVINYIIAVHNKTDKTIDTVEVTDPLKGKNEDSVVGILVNLEPDETRTCEFQYTVTMDDWNNGARVINQARASWTDEMGEHDVKSNRVLVYLTEEFVSVVKTVISSSKDPKGYAEGEKIRYRIDVTNFTLDTYYDMDILDYQNGAAVGVKIDTFPVLAPGETCWTYHEYTVQKSDVPVGKVINQASALIKGDKRNPDEEYFSNIVSSDVIKKKAEKPAETYCKRILTGLGDGVAEFDVEYCDIHIKTADRVKALLEKAVTEEDELAAWQKAVELWTEALKDEYDKALKGASQQKRAAIEDERDRFFEMIEARKLLLALWQPDDPALTAMQVSEAMMNRCVDLCYEMHTAPRSRIDSLVTGDYKQLEPGVIGTECVREVESTAKGATYRETICEAELGTEALSRTLIRAGRTEAAGSLWKARLDLADTARYLAANADGRKAILATRAAFSDWLGAREVMLAELYPKAPWIVGEVVTQTIRARVIDLCGK